MTKDAGAKEHAAGATGPLQRVEPEAERIARAAKQFGQPLWIAGGVAIQLYCRARIGGDALSRIPIDIDLAVPKGSGGRTSSLLELLGYRPNLGFNALNGRRRLLFYDEGNDRQLDVFVGGFEMCHAVPILARVDTLSGTVLLPAAELLLTKLQIVELTTKDVQDIVNLFANLDVADHDGEAINGVACGALCSNDWGLWRTSRANLDRICRSIDGSDLPDGLRDIVTRRVRTLQTYLDGASKPVRWRMRARLGDRVRWYHIPEEVGEAVPVSADVIRDDG